MLTRTGDFAQSSYTTQLLLAAQTRSRETQVQISSGKVASQFSAIADSAGRLVSAKDALQRIQQFQTSNQLIGDRLEAMESATASLVEIASQLRVLLIQRLDSAQGVPRIVTPGAEQLLEQAVASLNVAHDGRHLFAGSRNDLNPVVLDPAFTGFGAADDTYYQGDAVELSVRADVDYELTYGMSADREGFQELIGALRATIEGDGSDDRAMLESALALVNAALPKIAGYQGEIGARQAALDRVNLGHGDAELYLRRQIGDIENVDLTAAISRLSQDQMVIESAMATIAQLNRLSLVDFLR